MHGGYIGQPDQSLVLNKSMNTAIPIRATIPVILLFLFGCHRDGDGASPSTTNVQVHVVRAHDVPEEIICSGAIEVIHKADVAFMVPGRVVSVDVEDGALARQGQTLARLDPGDYEKALAIAEAQLDEVKARHSRLVRMHQLGSLTDTDFDKIEAALQQAQSAAELARRQVGYTELHAPFEGWIIKRGIAPGVVAAPAVPVFTLLSPGAVWANLGVAETDISKVHVGQKAYVYVSAAGQDAQMGTVDAILPSADILSRAFTVKVRLENAGGDLRHGNVVVGHILTGKTRHAITVPPQVVQKHPDGALFVWVVDPVRHSAVRRLIEVASLGATEVEVASGLKSGDQVILNVPHTLFEGAPITVASIP